MTVAIGAHPQVDALHGALGLLEDQVRVAMRWGERMADVLAGGGRLLAAGNGGSAAQAQHLTAELVGRFRGDRPAYSALCLSAETSSLTAIANDYGTAAIFARQVHAHGRPGDILLALSTSGASENVLRAAEAGRSIGMRVWALSGPAESPLSGTADEVIEMPAGTPASTVQELHLLLVHVMCSAFDQREAAGRSGP